MSYNTVKWIIQSKLLHPCPTCAQIVYGFLIPGRFSCVLNMRNKYFSTNFEIQVYESSWKLIYSECERKWAQVSNAFHTIACKNLIFSTFIKIFKQKKLLYTTVWMFAAKKNNIFRTNVCWTYLFGYANHTPQIISSGASGAQLEQGC